MSADDARLVIFTLWTSALAVACCLPLALALGWLLARKRWPLKSVVETLVSLPLGLPPVVTGLILLKVFSPRGPLGSFLESRLGIEVVFTWKAVVIALAVMAFPLVIRCVRTAFEEIPTRLEDAAATLGTHPLRVFFRISLPSARRGIMAGISLGFARAIGEFGATVMVAGLIPGLTETLPLAIYRSFQAGDDPRVWFLAGISAVLAYASIAVSERLASCDRGRRAI